MKKILLVIAALMLTGHAYAKDPIVAKVNGKSIRRSTVYRHLYALHGPRGVDQLINQMLIASEAKALNLKASEKDVTARIDEIKKQLPAGTSLTKQLTQVGLTIKALKKDIRQQILQTDLMIKMARISVSSVEVRGLFEANRDKLGTQEAIHLHQIQVATQQEASDILVALKAGADFGKLVAAKSTAGNAREKGGDLGFVAKGILRPELEKAVFDLQPGDISGAIRTPQGFQIFLGGERRQSKPAVFEDVASNLYRTLLAEKVRRASPAVMRALRTRAKIERNPL